MRQGNISRGGGFDERHAQEVDEMTEAGRDGLRVEASKRAMVSLEGLSCGDAFGECFFFEPRLRERVDGRVLPPGPWHFTDDTMMAISIAETLWVHGEIAEERLAGHFAQMYDPGRGYGPAMHGLLLRVLARGGAVWREEAGSLFEGRGSFGNGSAMRVPPLGAYFADDLARVVVEAERSAVTTHAHPEAVAGAIAVAVGAALAWRSRAGDAAPDLREFLEGVRELVPPSEVRDGIDRARGLRETMTAREAGAMLGSGQRVSAMDTVPFVLWSAGRFLESYEEAMWQTVSAGGDMDTTCAMVGGIVAMRTGVEGIPEEWRRRREPLGGVLRREG